MNNIIIIDNYDSFTYNLVHLVNEVSTHHLTVMRNDEVDYALVEECTHIILSPGPGIPDEAGDLKSIINTYCKSKKMLGVCLGHQAIGEVFGAELYNLPKVFHGKKTAIHQTAFKSPLFQDVDEVFFAGRYHSWAIDKSSDTSAFDITAIDDDGEIMALQHKTLQLYGVQFHPESIMTDQGKVILKNFIDN
jgi:anthranilate synthase/aminodeoxychorismate synthase-like glutamine amidotransferase